MWSGRTPGRDGYRKRTDEGRCNVMVGISVNVVAIAAIGCALALSLSTIAVDHCQICVYESAEAVDRSNSQ